jgi:signal transduction histidine kinase
MLQKINQIMLLFRKEHPFPFYVRIVILYSTIVFLIMLFVSLITVTSVHYILEDSIKKDLVDTSDTCISYLDSHGKVDTSLFIYTPIQPAIVLQIFDNTGRLVIDNSPSYSSQEDPDRYLENLIQQYDSSSLPSDVIGEGTDEFTYYQTWNDPKGQVYFLRLSRKVLWETSFVSLLIKQLLASILISLVLMILSGIYLTRKSLAPLNTIRRTLQNIEVNKLDDRIRLSTKKDEIYDLAVTINQTLDRIEYGYKQQQQFISDASHELRTPLTVISGYIDILARWGKDDKETLEESITAIQSETEYMRQLIERLLFFARSSRGTLPDHFAKIDTADLLLEIYHATQCLVNEHRLSLGKIDHGIIFAEPGSIKQMLRIFIDNALKYTPDNGTITLSCEVYDGNAHFIVKDTGIGIPKEDLKRVFERFYRVDSSRTKATGGTGLGLSIAKHIAQGNGASLTLDSELHQGTTVTAIFKLYDGSQNTPQKA